ncbi:MAG: pyridoxal phosphate-dependent aminotransferase [Rhodospirillaceae bacterium]|jgi:aspartate/methionine/tyrosine aminotransferase|nr:pyridoxal phosphate-dependent aminotransferase [Alphaproteobacteria bacterium]MBT4688569.1 pyridoxal phosphate-dependent aminotransferase [Rhodospirillaceae bacterium]MBT5080975.1 pyridoxal phosphate-dependent aminotransferase [Rhodospirillaceae bacterium]MBT5527358.1 pyridoxal phosphate-dependent aminotransferase [Rhodospirillaceae bacterium]MBT5878366.1 pyridoxal phosphate-dependent aminotransferase [Rhodospirillaceae bacterium]
MSDKISSKLARNLESGPVGARDSVERLGNSLIRDVANAGMGLDDVVALWYGEPDLPTPDFICQAATASLARGETFYTPNFGIDELREALAEYMTGLYQRPIDSDRVAVTASGMSATNLMQQVLTNPGDNVVVTAPVWPNLIETVRVMGGEPRFAWLQFGNQGWSLDLEQMFSMVDERTRAILINSPSNPTGWVMSLEEMAEVLDFCRARGIWVLSDEVYARMVFDRQAAPSFLEIAEPDDRLVVVNSFSKSWCMTGWRLGWLTAPPALMPTLEKMIEFHYSCPAHFSQVAGITAVREGEDFVVETVARYKQARDLVIDRLQALPKVRVHRPDGAFYAFFAVDGMTDSLATCKEILAATHVGLAPGAAFGDKGEGFIRLCFASTLDRLDNAMDRLEPYLS